MATRLNRAKMAKQASREAAIKQDEARAVTEIRNGEEHVIAVRTDKVDSAKEATVIAETLDGVIINELEKDSKVKHEYVNDRKKHRIFLDDIKELERRT